MVETYSTPPPPPPTWVWTPVGGAHPPVSETIQQFNFQSAEVLFN